MPPNTNPNAPLRAALYARYSSDRQRETSIDDQLRAARARAAAEGWSIVAEHCDEGVSGTVPVALRKGGKALLADALAARFDILIMEGLDRLSRDMGEQDQVVKRLEFRGIRLLGTGDGYDTQTRGRKVMRVARGLVNELYLDDLREKTHRGLAGQFDRGYHVGGVCFGYRSQATADGRGRELVIDEAQAAIVRRIFTEYADGSGPRAIVYRLNAEGIASPRGGTWAVSALVGDRARGAGLLNSEIYIGRLVWNRRQWVKDPETGKRRYVDRPRDEWQVREVPHLRIIDADLWAAAKARERHTPSKGGAKMRTLFAGLLRCAQCGGPIIAFDYRRYGCNVRRDRGDTVCSCSDTFLRSHVDQALLSVVREDLLAPDVLATVTSTVQAAVRAALAERAAQAATAPGRRAELQAEIDRLVDAVAQVGMSAALRERLATAEAELASLPAAVPAAQPGDVQRLTQQAIAAYKRRLLDLSAALQQQQDGDRDRTRALLSEILGPVVLRRDEEGDWAEMEEPAQRVALAGSTLMTVVARACNVRRKLIRPAG